jgi:hypothetical protein
MMKLLLLPMTVNCADYSLFVYLRFVDLMYTGKKYLLQEVDSLLYICDLLICCKKLSYRIRSALSWTQVPSPSDGEDNEGYEKDPLVVSRQN